MMKKHLLQMMLAAGIVLAGLQDGAAVSAAGAEEESVPAAEIAQDGADTAEADVAEPAGTGARSDAAEAETAAYEEQPEADEADVQPLQEDIVPEGKKDEKLLKKQVFTKGDAEGLIDDDGESVSAAEGESLEEVLAQEEAALVKIPGFSVDPAKYPAANITENTAVIYHFLTAEMGLNHAAACGVLANIQMEANFRPIALGDGGTSYGICQWHLGRFSRLMSFCGSAGLDYNTLEGQLAYLQYELVNYYPHVLAYLEQTEDTRMGAYLAGYLFCLRFEMPDQTEARSAQRGNLAANEFYPRDFSAPAAARKGQEAETDETGAAPEDRTDEPSETEEDNAGPDEEMTADAEDESGASAGEEETADMGDGSPLWRVGSDPLGYETISGIWIPIRQAADDEYTAAGAGMPGGSGFEWLDVFDPVWLSPEMKDALADVFELPEAPGTGSMWVLRGSLAD